MSAQSRKSKKNQKLEFTNLEKIFYPATGFTKGDLLKYYSDIAEFILPHLKNRAITMKRFPDGVNGLFFYEKQCPAYAPEWIQTTKVARENGSSINYCMVNDLRSLLWMGNIANLEFHTFLHKASKTLKPDAMAFDLDPGAPADINTCAQVALMLRKLLDSINLESFPKTSGSKGLQVYVPLNTPCSYDETKQFAHNIAIALEQQHPEVIVSKMPKKLRSGKVLIDWSQNDKHKTTACVYTLRAKQIPTVSTPLTWDEVAYAVKKKKAALLNFDSVNVLKRVRKSGDLFAAVLTLKQKLPLTAFKQYSND